MFRLRSLPIGCALPRNLFDHQSIPSFLYVLLLKHMFRHLSRWDLLVKSINEGTVTIAFARSKDGADMQVPIDLGVEDTNNKGEKVRSSKAATNFMQCASDLIDAERDRLNNSK